MADKSDRVNEVIAEQLGVDGEEIFLDSSLRDDLGADSLDLVELALAIEDEFEIEVPDRESSAWERVADVHNSVSFLRPPV